MKPVIIIAIAVLCSVVAVFGTQFLFVGNNEIIIDNQSIMNNEFIMDNEIINSLTFDCAKQWDEYYDSYNKMQGRLGDSYKQSMKTIEAEEIGIGFIKNNCVSTVNEWAYRTQDENTVWYSGMDWQKMDEMEEKRHRGNP